MKKLLFTMLLPFLAQASTITSSLLVTDGGIVTVYYMGESADYVEDTYFVGPTSSVLLFSNHPGPAIGTPFNLGYLAGGTQLQFSVAVHDTGLTFLSGGVSPDGYSHFRVQAYAAGGGVPAGWPVGVEDILGGGDRDNDDTEFLLAIAPGVPEPGTVVMLGLGVVLIAVRRRK